MNNSAFLGANSFTFNPLAARPPICPRPWSAAWITHKVLRSYNRARHAIVKQRNFTEKFEELRGIRALASHLTDIDEHLELMFLEALACKPQLIVELGVRGGTSTFIFDKVSALCGGTLISADLDNCAGASSSPRWHFVQGDDVSFARMFPRFCAERGVTPSIDLLFLDTSHYYDHTVEEIAAWFPHLAPHAKVMFHDTNLKVVGPRRDGCFALAWDNQRGVIRAIEERLNIQINESKQCVEYADGWLLRHWPNCNGFTIMDRLSA
jgi:cephalosporin hydroxylase